MANYNTSGMIAKVKTLAAVPSNQPAFTDANLITIIDDELQSTVVPFIVSLNSDYFLTYKDVTIVAGVDEYRIPERAVGSILYGVKLVTTDDEYDIPLVDAKNSTKVFHTSYFIRGNYIHLLGNNIGTNDTVRMYYYRRANSLISILDCATVDSVTGNDITFTGKPSSWTGSTKCDIIQSVPPFDTLAEDVLIDLSGATYTFSSIPRDLEVGCYVCLAGEAPVAQIPWDAVQLLNQLAVLRIMESQSDKDGYRLAQERYTKLETDIQKILSPRVSSEQKPIVNYNALA